MKLLRVPPYSLEWDFEQDWQGTDTSHGSYSEGLREVQTLPATL